MKLNRVIVTIALLILSASQLLAQEKNGVDPEALIEQILQVDRLQRDQIQDLTLEALLIEGKRDRDSLIEKERFVKKIYVKHMDDTSWFHEEFLEFYKEGELQSDKDRDKAAKEKAEKRKKRRSMDISYAMLKPFEPDQREFYKIEYKGVTEDVIEGFTCHHFRVDATEKEPTRVNGDFYFELDGFHLVRAEFTPSKRASNLMFKMKKLDMSLTYKSYANGFWLPSEFNIDGKGKIGFLFGITFAGREVYSNPLVNSGLSDEIFQEESK